ncbi:MAG TPA: phosphoenolpyruvate--protein phosphotransferase, partial [Planctomycetia bacterium]|nr:phosphoenolpyruvate--protein phosphotransferase [Planctomycetia bacterium]
MESAHGIAVFPGVAIGPAFLLDRDGLHIPRRFIDAEEIPAEIARLDESLAALIKDIDADARAVEEKLGREVAQIFQAHRALVADPHLREQIVAKIEGSRHAAEYAVRQVFAHYADVFRSMHGSPFADRASDMQDLERRTLGKLIGDPMQVLRGRNHDVVVIARDLTPSETVSFDPKIVKGMATESGGRTSHTAIVAGAMEIPAVVGLGALPEVADGETVIVDGNRGVLIVGPDEPTLQRYHAYAREQIRQDRERQELRALPATTLDGHEVKLLGNIEFPHETQHCHDYGADGIGLYRTEFLYLSRTTAPTEEEHYAAYSEVLKAMGPERPVTFRTLDLGADKVEHGSKRRPEANPFLGLRSVRLSLKNPAMFKIQLRAMLRASVLGDLRIMFPLISTLRELRRCKMILRDVMEDLEEEGAPFRRDIPVGMMMEVPSAALLAPLFAQHVDFFSIGTNDLIQYTLAVDRTNADVATLYSASDPAVLRLVKRVVDAARTRGIPVNLCGEMSGDPTYAALLVGLGLRQMSVTPHNIPAVKQAIRRINVREARRLADRVLRLDSAADITKYLRSKMPDDRAAAPGSAPMAEAGT